MSAPLQQQILLHGIRWQTYEQMLDDLGERPVRLTFDRGDLEIMTLSHRHEYVKTVLGRMIETLTEEANLPLGVGGSMTWKRSDLGKGLEPDESYWVQNEPLVRGRTDVDPERDLPPDLVVEVDVSTRSLNRLAIYAAFGVPEVWRHDGEGVRVHVLGEDRSYRECERGVAFPWLAATDLTSWLEQASRTDLTTWIRRFRGWVRTVLPTS